jgi:phosphate transport system substrate-binding protein
MKSVSIETTNEKELHMRRLILFSLLAVLLVVSACAAPAAPAAPAVATAVSEAMATEAPAAEAAPAEAGMLPEVDPLAVTGDIISAGSSTVYPLSEAVAEQFIDEGYAGNITIDSIGTGGGFERFCVAGETDVANASRAIKDSERESCVAIGRDPLEFRVGTDALAIVVNLENDWLTAGVTKEQLAMIFSDQTTNWSDVDPAWPAEPIQRFSPGTDSGTFDYFVEAVMNPTFVKDAEADAGKGEEALLKAANLQLSEDDNVLVQGVEGNKNAIGYFGFAYFAENEDKLQAVSVDGVAPSAATVNDGTYPLARPLFIYSDGKVIQEKPQVGQFINYYLTNVNDLIRRVGYFPAPEADLDAAKATLATALGQ